MSDDLWMVFVIALCAGIVWLGCYRSARGRIMDQIEIDASLTSEESAAVARHLELEAARSGVMLETEERSRSWVGKTNEVAVFGCRPGTLLCISEGPDLKLLYRQEGWTRV